MMGCFVSCFGACKHRKRLHLVAATLPPEDHIDEACAKVPQFCESTKQELVAEPVKPSTKSKRRLGDLLSLSGKKKVTFHLTVKSYEGISTGGITDEATRHKVGEGETKEREGREEPAKDNQSVSESINFKFSSNSEDERHKDRGNQEYRDLELEHCNLDDNNGGEKDNVGAGGLGMAQEHSNLDDNNGGEKDNVGGDGQGMVREHSNLDDNNGGEKDNVGGNGQGMVPKESSESLFSLSIESRKHDWDAEMDEKEVTSSALKCSSHNIEQKASGSDLERNSEALNGDANSVLTPVEHLTKLKTVKARATIIFQGEDKENMKAEQGFGEEISPGPSFKVCTIKKNDKAETKVKSFRDEEVAVDTSLSSWLVSTPISRTSPNSVGNSPSLEARTTTSGDDKPVLSVLTGEKLKHLSSSNAPRRLRSRTPDETHVIGTVGSYWRHTGRIIDPILALQAKGQ
ncbi:hypothetical protein K2173_013143 [Erythroxylum novogranatense]|uniref:Uncharacterized protein n=1 Tax=Erythroxylum novogranatense TaxID=1862640 RepID=A0AAV8S6K1_9ROSI|nr:hypothetical protein K2173_013143 [Erythroxylum novogranatense]